MKSEHSSIENGPNISEECFYCGSALNRLGDGRVQCKKCRKRYAPGKLKRQLALAHAFCRDQSAKEAAERLGVNYLTALNFYQRLRQRLLGVLESDYEAARDRVSQYEKTLYLDHNKRRDKRHIFEAQNFLTFAYGERVYNILMPSLERYKQPLIDDGLYEQYWEEFSRFFIFHRIAKLESRENTIEAFRRYFDHFMKNYRGIKRENFIYYLKEAEFKFNYGEECFEKLMELMRRSR
ncbi:transposase [Nitratifractor salsuginis DSM 16511]|uniref:Transposase n=1 Tax=Nitratifractor salsuginis (strain DSM 16511 / JCM 12458 / E9I37-1) TaxID=749222 RepID=E6WYA5_NITSE|nr:transposase [Nitratifractor salsuginis DSM 16511]